MKIFTLFHSKVCIFFTAFICLEVDAFGLSNWWNLGLLSTQTILNKHSMRLKNKCMQLYGLSKTQARQCELLADHIPVVGIGARISISECKRQFQFRPWNCSSSTEDSAFGPVTHRANRESGFVHAISSAGVVHAVARSCRNARLLTCGCSNSRRPDQLQGDWLWGGCGDNLKYAYRFARGFIDRKEREKSYPRGSPQLARMLMNLHNNRAGRMAVRSLSTIGCKCHGVSGSCSLKTCWEQLVAFTKIGEEITKYYDRSQKVKFNKRGTKLKKMKRKGKNRRPDRRSLIFLEESPHFCEPDLYLGWPGNKGRVCHLSVPGSKDNRTVQQESCSRICCHRGYDEIVREIRERCNCKFVWCCHVMCETCFRLEQVSICR